MTHNWKIKKQNFFCLQSKNFPPDKRHPGHRSRYGKYGLRSGYGFLRIACQPIRIENQFEKPYNKSLIAQCFQYTDRFSLIFSLLFPYIWPILLNHFNFVPSYPIHVLPRICRPTIWYLPPSHPSAPPLYIYISTTESNNEYFEKKLLAKSWMKFVPWAGNFRSRHNSCMQLWQQASHETHLK
jgi:hypothetical protein